MEMDEVKVEVEVNRDGGGENCVGRYVNAANGISENLFKIWGGIVGNL